MKAANPELYARSEELAEYLRERNLTASEVDRRDFLRQATRLGIVGLSLQSLAGFEAVARTWHERPRTTPWKDYAPKKGRGLASSSSFGSDPIVILGGGLAGLTAAYRLQRRGVSCEIYEGASRLGGRVFTRNGFNPEGMFCELGGELIDSIHRDILQLAQEFRLDIDDFRNSDSGVEKELYFFAGRRFYESDLIPLFQPMAAILNRDIAEVFPPTSQWIINYRNYNAAGQRIDRMSLRQYLDQARAPGVERWVIDLLDVAYSIEYGLETSLQSAINLLYLIDPNTKKGFKIFGASDEAHRIRGGNSRLTEALAAAIRGTVPVRLEHRLLSIADNGREFTLVFEQNGQRVTRRASQVLCTIPFRMLREVEGISRLGLTPQKLLNIQTSGFGTNSKYMVGFREKLWRRTNGSIPAQTGTIYTDLGTQSYWETSRLQSGQRGILTNYSGGNYGASISTQSLSKVLDDLERMYPGIRALYDGSSALMKWSSYPLTQGSYSCPMPGQYTTIYGSGAEPELNARLLFAGEHCSEMFQGFMNGAVETGNYAAYIALEQRGRSVTTSARENREASSSLTV